MTDPEQLPNNESDTETGGFTAAALLKGILRPHIQAATANDSTTEPARAPEVLDVLPPAET